MIAVPSFLYYKNDIEPIFYENKACMIPLTPSMQQLDSPQLQASRYTASSYSTKALLSALPDRKGQQWRSSLRDC